MATRSLPQLAMELLRLLFLWHLMCHLCNATDMSRRAGSADDECGQGYFLSKYGDCRPCPPCTEDTEVSSLPCKIIQHNMCVNRTKGFLKIACRKGMEITLLPLDKSWKRTKYHVQLCKLTQQHALKVVKKRHPKQKIKCSRKKANFSRCKNKGETGARQGCLACPGARVGDQRCKTWTRQCTSPRDVYNATLFRLSCSAKPEDRLLLVDVYSPLKSRVSISRQRAVQTKLQDELCSLFPVKDYGIQKTSPASRNFINDQSASTEKETLYTNNTQRTTLPPAVLTAVGLAEMNKARSMATSTEYTRAVMNVSTLEKIRNDEEIDLEEKDFPLAASDSSHTWGKYVVTSVVIVALCTVTLAAVIAFIFHCRVRKKKLERSSVLVMPELNTQFDSREDSLDKQESSVDSNSHQVQLESVEGLSTVRKYSAEDKIISVIPSLPDNAAFQQSASGAQILEMSTRRQTDLYLNMSSGYRNDSESLRKETLQNSSASDGIYTGCNSCLDSGVYFPRTRSLTSSSEVSSLSHPYEESLAALGSSCQSQRSSVGSLQSTSTESSVRVPISLPLDDDWLKKDIDFGAVNLLPTYASYAATQTDASPGLDSEPTPMFCALWQTFHTLSSSGGSFRIQNSEAKLSVPPNAIKTGSYLDIRAATSTNLPFVHRSLQLTEEEVIVSPVVEFHAEECFQFDRPVEITVPHFLPISHTDDDVKVYHVDRRHDGSFRLLRLPSETEYTRTRKNNSVSLWTPGNNDGTNLDRGCQDVGFFKLLPDGRLVVNTKSFCGYFCTSCRVEHSQLHLLVFGSHKKLSHDQRNVKIFLYLWDKRITIEDFQRDYLPSALHGHRHSLLASKTLSIVSDLNFMKSFVILHFYIHHSCASEWRHAVRGDTQEPIFPVRRQFILDKVLHVKTETPRCEEWLIENISGCTPDEVFQGYVDATNISQHQLSSVNEAVSSGDAESVTVFLDVQLRTPDAWNLEQLNKTWNRNPSAAEDSANQFGQKVSSLTERKYPIIPPGIAVQEETDGPYQRPVRQGSGIICDSFTDPSHAQEHERSAYQFPDPDLTAEEDPFCCDPSLPSAVRLSCLKTLSSSAPADLRSGERYCYTDHPESQSPWHLGQRTSSFPNNESCGHAVEKAIPTVEVASSDNRDEQLPPHPWRD